jgi:hypothetical protein
MMKVRHYTGLLTIMKSMSATYKKRGTELFNFSASYENTELGCDASICTSFGNVIYNAKEICNCGGF